MGWFWATLGVIAVLVLGAAALVDRQTRKRGHRVRSAGEVQRAIRERRREFRRLPLRDLRRQKQNDLGRP
jgi:hypothetical protein